MDNECQARSICDGSSSFCPTSFDMDGEVCDQAYLCDDGSCQRDKLDHSVCSTLGSGSGFDSCSCAGGDNSIGGIDTFDNNDCIVCCVVNGICVPTGTPQYASQLGDVPIYYPADELCGGGSGYCNGQ